MPDRLTSINPCMIKLGNYAALYKMFPRLLLRWFQVILMLAIRKFSILQQNLYNSISK